MKLNVYDEIISIGCDCTLTFNLRRTFGITAAFPFDWWVTPLPALMAWLEEPSVERLYDPSLLEPMGWDGMMKPVGWDDVVQGLRNRHYGILIQHEFPKGENGGIRSDWREHLDGPRTRSQHLLDRFLALPSTAKRVLFVRSFVEPERQALAGRILPLMQEVRTLLERRLPGLEFELLLVNSPDDVDRPGLRCIRVDDPQKSDWRGDKRIWRKQLRRANLIWAGEPLAQERIAAAEEAPA